MHRNPTSVLDRMLRDARHRALAHETEGRLALRMALACGDVQRPAGRFLRRVRERARLFIIARRWCEDVQAALDDARDSPGLAEEFARALRAKHATVTPSAGRGRAFVTERHRRLRRRGERRVARAKKQSLDEREVNAVIEQWSRGEPDDDRWPSCVRVLAAEALALRAELRMPETREEASSSGRRAIQLRLAVITRDLETLGFTT